MESSEATRITTPSTSSAEKIRELQLNLHQLIEKQKTTLSSGSETTKSPRSCAIHHDSWIRNEIFRLTTILKIFGKSTPPTTYGEEGIPGDPKERIAMSRADTNSTNGVNCGHTSSNLGFHSHLELLPNEMKVPILEYLDDPQDKLNMIDLLPSADLLMGWNRTLVQFEIIFPLIASYQIAGDWKNLLNLCQAAPALEAVVLKHFQSSFDEPKRYQQVAFPTRRFHQITVDSHSRHFLKKIGHRFMPSTRALPFGLYFSIREEFSPVITTILENIGGKLWSAWFDLEMRVIPDIIEKLAECFQMTPNLQSLQLQEWKGHRTPINRHMEADQNLLTPDLPQLKYLNLFGDCTQILTWILPKYTRQLESLHLYHCHLSDGYDVNCFPKLKHLSISTFHDFDESYDPDIEKIEIQLSSKFGLCPLKIIYVTVDKADTKKWSKFLLSLNTFGGTLEVLEINFGNCNDFDDGADMRLVILHLNFPRLNTLHLGMYPGSLDFLVGLPTLTRLSIGRSNNCLFDDDGLFRFHQGKERMIKESQVWKLLPNLKLLQIHFNMYQKHPWGECYKSGEEAFKITRSDYLRAINQNHSM